MSSVGSRMCPVRQNHGSSDQLPSSSNNGVDNYERNNPGFRGPWKRGNHQCINGSASLSSSSSGAGAGAGAGADAPLHQWEDHLESGVLVLDAVAFAPPHSRSRGVSIREGVPLRSMRSGSSATHLDSALPHYHNHLLGGNFRGQFFQPPSHAWVEQQYGEGNYAAAVPYLHGSSFNGGSSEIGSVGGRLRGYQATANSRSSMDHYLHHHHHPPPPRQGLRGPNFNYHTQVPTSSYRHPTNTTLLHHGTMNPSRDGLETGPRYPTYFPPTGLRINRPHQRGVPQAAPEDGNRPRLRLLPEEEVAILELPGFYEVGNLADNHRDLLLDIDEMSYEELLALGERIGNVKTGLSTILRGLKTRTYVSAAMDEETDICIICQAEYENQEEIGILNCGHEYHADCVKKWLLVKNVCPICKIPAFAEESQDE